MLFRALAINIGTLRVGTLFKYGTDDPIIRFVASDDYIDLPQPPTLSLSMQAADPAQQRAFWADVTQPVFNGSYSAKKDAFLLPAFFQGLLPEGVFRDHIAAERKFCVDRYSDTAVGLMEKNIDGRMAMSVVTLRPAIEFSGDLIPSRRQIDQMHHEAHKECFIANSVKSEVRCEPVYPR